MKRWVLAAIIGVLTSRAVTAHADAAAGRDSVCLVGEFADPVCVFQHGMFGTSQRACAAVPGRVDQGMAFYDIRERRMYAVIGMTHTENPRAEFLRILGDTVAVDAQVWKAGGSSALTIRTVYPVDRQLRARYRWWPWRWHASVLVGCATLALAYLVAVGPLRRRLGGPLRFPAGRAVTFLLGLLAMILALNGPIHDLSDQYLFSTHMFQHLVLALEVPPLLLLGIPAWLWDWLLQSRAMTLFWRKLASIPTGAALYTLVFAIWHVPVLYNLMMRDHRVHILMHLLVIATAVLMWWPILGKGKLALRLSPPAQMFYLFALSAPPMLLAVILALSQRPLYEWYALAPRLWGLTALQDQRWGALLMGIPGGLLYWVLVVVLYRRSARLERDTADLYDPVGRRAAAAPALEPKGEIQ